MKTTHLVFATMMLAVLSSTAGDRLPTIEVLYPNYPLPGLFRSFRETDLKESEAAILGEGGKVYVKAHLHKGLYEVQHKDISDWLRLNWVSSPNQEIAEAKYGIADFDWVSTGASASDYGVIQVLQLCDGRLKITQQIVFNTRGSNKAGATFDPKTNTLTIRGIHGWEHCCASQLDVVQFRFAGNTLQRVSYRQIPLA